MAAASSCSVSFRPCEITGSSCSFPAFAESLKTLLALVTYLRIWVDFWVATQLLATKKIREKQRMRTNTLPKSVNHGGKARSRRSCPLASCREPPPEPAGLPLRRTFGLDPRHPPPPNDHRPRRTSPALRQTSPRV